MDILDRFAAILLVIIFVVLVPASMSMRDCGNNLELCASESVDDFLADVGADRVFTEERFYTLSALLYACGYQNGFELTEYYYEDGMDGKQYQYTVSFAEICKEISEHGTYEFKAGSYLYISVAGYSPRNLLARILYSRKTIQKSIRLG